MHHAYTSQQDADREAALPHRFGKRWPLLRETYLAIARENPGLAAYDKGVRLTAKAAAPLRSAAKALRSAQKYALQAQAMWQPYLPRESIDLPDFFFEIAFHASAVEMGAADVRRFVDAARGERGWGRGKLSRAWLVRLAAKRGIRARAADWCIAFIALTIDERIAPKDVRDAGHEWSQRVSQFSKEARKAGLPVLPAVCRG